MIGGGIFRRENTNGNLVGGSESAVGCGELESVVAGGGEADVGVCGVGVFEEDDAIVGFAENAP